MMAQYGIGYILGEYGHLVANDPGVSPIQQFQALHSKSPYCSAPTRALLLTTYIKWVNVFPEIKDHLINVFERYRYVLDAELQQRACEYYAIATRPDEELLQQMCEEMPPFPARESTLLSRLNKKHGDTEDSRVWVIGGKETNDDRERAKGRKPTGDVQASSPTASNGPDLMSLAGLDLNGPSTAKPVLNTSPSIDKWYEKLCMSNDGILYEDNAIQMGIKSEYHGHLGKIALYVGNKMTVPLTSFTATVTGYNTDALSLIFAKIPPNVVNPKTQAQHVIHVESKKPFDSPPILMISYLAGSLTTINIQLPLLVTKFFEGVTLTQTDFFERWKLIGGPPREAQLVFPITLDSSGNVDLAKNRKVLIGHGFSLLSDIDPNPINLVGAGVLHTSAAGKVGCLLRVEPNKVAKVSCKSRVS
jgi:AP-2 complex subunit alpha